MIGKLWACIDLSFTRSHIQSSPLLGPCLQTNEVKVQHVASWARAQLRLLGHRSPPRDVFIFVSQMVNAHRLSCFTRFTRCWWPLTPFGTLMEQPLAVQAVVVHRTVIRVHTFSLDTFFPFLPMKSSALATLCSNFTCHDKTGVAVKFALSNRPHTVRQAELCCKRFAYYHSYSNKRNPSCKQWLTTIDDDPTTNPRVQKTTKER